MLSHHHHHQARDSTQSLDQIMKEKPKLKGRRILIDKNFSTLEFYARRSSNCNM